MSAETIARHLSHEQREKLIAHVVGPQPVSVRYRDRIDRQVTKALMQRALVFQRGDHLGDVKKPKLTAISELGREVACIVLAGYAEALVRAGCMDDMRSLKMSPMALREMRLLTTSAAALTEPLPLPSMMASHEEEAADERLETSHTESL